MKTTYTIIALSLFITTTGLLGQGLHVEDGSGNTGIQTGGYAWIGFTTGFYLSLDNNEIQARDGTNPSTLYMNYWGGHIDLLGFGNGTGDLLVDNNGLYYDNATNRTGLGTAAPEARLHIFNGGGVLGSAANSQVDAIIEDNASAYFLLNGSNSFTSGYLFANATNSFAGGMFYTPSNNLLRFASNGSYRMNINAAGDVGIGTTTPSAKLEIVHNSSTSDAHLELTETTANDFARIKLVNSGNSSEYWDIAGRSGTDDELNFYSFHAGSGRNLISIISNLSNTSFDTDLIATSTAYDVGNNGTTETWDQMYANSYNSPSDQRLKVGIQELPATLDRIKQLRPVTYKYKEEVNPNGRQRLGLIAQEVLPLFPEAVVSEDVDIDPVTGEKIVTQHDFYAMNYTELIPALVKAIQEQQAQIEEMEQRLREVESSK